MKKKYIVRLTDEERGTLKEVPKKLKEQARKFSVLICYSKRMQVEQTGSINKSLMRFIAVRRPLRTFVNV